MSSTACLDNERTTPRIRLKEAFRMEKVLQIRHRIRGRRYSVAVRLDAAIDRLLEDVLR